MWVKSKVKGRVYYDAEQKKTIDDKRSYEVKATGLIRELIKTGKLIEADKPTEAAIKKYAAEDKAIADRKEKLGKVTGTAKTVEGQLKAKIAELVKANSSIEALEEELATANESLVKANLEITVLKETAEKAGDPESQEVKDLKEKKEAAVDPKKETTKTPTGEKA